MKRVAIIWGTRPEHIKIYPVYKALVEQDVDVLTIFTGQHLDLVDHKHLYIPIDYKLGVMRVGQSLSDLLAKGLYDIQQYFDVKDVGMVLVQGDTSSALAGSIWGFYNEITVAHIEAGLTTSDLFDPFPEEMHRRLIRELSTYHFAPTRQSEENLIQFNVNSNNIFVTGNTVIDTLKYIAEIESIEYPIEPENKVLITIHRRENDKNLLEICTALNLICNILNEYKFEIVVHPRNKSIVEEYLKNIKIIDPLNYVSFLRKIVKCNFVITDSGGLQEECSVLGVPVYVVRNKTERVESIFANLSRLVRTKQSDITCKISQGLDDGFAVQRKSSNIYGDGKAGERIAEIIREKL